MARLLLGASDFAADVYKGLDGPARYKGAGSDWPDAFAAPPTSTNFFGTVTPDYIETGDTTNYGLGMQFSTSVAGSVTQLRHYHPARAGTGTHDAYIRLFRVSDGNFTFVREALATVDKAFVGWVDIDITPYALTIGTAYNVAIEHFNGPYPADTSYFGSPVTDPTGALTAPVAAGKYAEFEVSRRPYNSYLNSNYYLDVTFVPA